MMLKTLRRGRPCRSASLACRVPLIQHVWSANRKKGYLAISSAIQQSSLLSSIVIHIAAVIRAQLIHYF